jgi:hypothetical protein
MRQDDLVDEVQALKAKVNELTFENERLEFELRDAQRELSKLRPPREMEIQMQVGPRGITVLKDDAGQEDLTQQWGHQDS